MSPPLIALVFAVIVDVILYFLARRDAKKKNISWHESGFAAVFITGVVLIVVIAVWAILWYANQA